METTDLAPTLVSSLGDFGAPTRLRFPLRFELDPEVFLIWKSFRPVLLESRELFSADC
jgi:hypothetical protein